MRCPLVLLTLVAASASAQSTYATPNEGTLNLVAGLTTLTDYSAANSNATAENLAFITDSSWSSTGVVNIGWGAMPAFKNGALAGNFGGGTYHDANYSIIMIGMTGIENGVQFWGDWNVQLLLSNGTYSSAIRFTSFDVVDNSTSKLAPPFQFYNAPFNNVQTVQEQAPTGYLRLDISDFDLANIGVTGIKFSGFSDNSLGLDLTYVGVVGAAPPIPEPSTYGLALGGLALGIAALRRRRKSAM